MKFRILFTISLALLSTGLLAEDLDQKINEVKGNLTALDETYDTGEYYDAVTFDVTRGDILKISLSSNDFDTYLSAVTPLGSVYSNDDIEGNASSDSELVLLIDGDGELALEITSYYAEETGSYLLKSSVISSSSETQYYGLFIGLTDYMDAPDDLEHCSDDALRLSRTMAHQKLTEKGSMILLTNNKATGQAVRNAARELMAKMTENDTFFFFFSGHGDRNLSETSTEADSCVESLCLFDEDDITDMELNEIFADCPGNIIFVLDSCFSGGMNLDQRPGLFTTAYYSSQEYLESNVPDFDAGGYLSHFFNKGLSGEADFNEDRIITVGEINYYLNEQWYSDQGPLLEDNQFLVIDPGNLRNFMPLFVMPE